MTSATRSGAAAAGKAQITAAATDMARIKLRRWRTGMAVSPWSSPHEPDVAQITLHARVDLTGARCRGERVLRRGLAALVQPLDQRGVPAVERPRQPIGDVIGERR